MRLSLICENPTAARSSSVSTCSARRCAEAHKPSAHRCPVVALLRHHEATSSGPLSRGKRSYRKHSLMSESDPGCVKTLVRIMIPLMILGGKLDEALRFGG